MVVLIVSMLGLLLLNSSVSFIISAGLIEWPLEFALDLTISQQEGRDHPELHSTAQQEKKEEMNVCLANARD